VKSWSLDDAVSGMYGETMLYLWESRLCGDILREILTGKRLKINWTFSSDGVIY